jgi:hypothetical protein
MQTSVAVNNIFKKLVLFLGIFWAFFWFGKTPSNLKMDVDKHRCHGGCWNINATTNLGMEGGASDQ